MGKGDQKYLTDLRIDKEPIQHEVGHHVFYRTVKNMSGDSLILHEAVADIFVMYQTKNSCIAEFVCKIPSPCMEKGKCLRTGDNRYTLDTIEKIFPSKKTKDKKTGKIITTNQEHKRSQLISGMISDIGQKIGFEKAGDILYKAITFLPRDCDYSDLLFGFFKAEDLLYKKKNCSDIKEIVKERGFEKQLNQKKIKC